MIRYLHADAKTPRAYRDGFVAAYQEAFCGPPYYESYSAAEILEKIWEPHLDDGVISLALDGHHVVGFGCIQPQRSAPKDVGDFLNRHRSQGTFPVSDDDAVWYISELGVRNTHRGQRLGYTLTKHKLHQAHHVHGAKHYTLRTAATGSNSLHLYRKIGAVDLPDIHDISTSAQVRTNGSKSTQRVYLYGDCADALRTIDTILG